MQLKLIMLDPGVNPSELYGLSQEQIRWAEQRIHSTQIGGWLTRRVFKLFGVWHIGYWETKR